MLGPAIGGLAALGGPHVPFYVAGVLASINAMAAIDPPARDAPSRRARPARRGLKHARHRRSCATWPSIGFITVVAFTAFEATFALFGDRRFGLTEASTAAVFLGVGLVLVVIQGGAYGRLVERFGTERLFAVGLSLLVAGLAVMAVAKVWPVLIVALLLLSVGQGCRVAVDHVAGHRACAAGSARRGIGLSAVGERGRSRRRPAGCRVRCSTGRNLEPVRRRCACCAPWRWAWL